jgi:aspartyl aminopeptidase
MLFEYLKDIFIRKKGTLPLDDYIPFLINRWISFVGNSAISINESVNKLSNLDKQQHYKLLISCIPKQKQQPFIKYIKRVKEEKTKEDDKVSLLASNMEMSEREVKQLLELREQFT